MFNFSKKVRVSKPDEEVEEVDTLTIEEVNEDLQRHKQATARRFEENEDRLRTATNSLRQRLEHLNALVDKGQKRRV